MIGIYKIVCIANNRFYIGSSKNVVKRFKKHKALLKSGVHPNRYLQNAWSKYGEDKFSFEVIEKCDISTLIEKEQFWIDSMKSFNREIGFNLSPTANSSQGVKWSINTRENCGKKWIVYDPSNKEIQINNLNLFCELQNLNVSSMLMVANGKRKHCKKWKCRKITDDFDLWKRKNESIGKLRKVKREFWTITTPNNEIINTNNLPDFCKDNNLCQRKMYRVASGKRLQHKGWKCRKSSLSESDWQALCNKYHKKRSPSLHNSKTWKVTSPSGMSFLVQNLESFCKSNNLTASALRAVAYGKRKHHKKWKCRLEEKNSEGT